MNEYGFEPIGYADVEPLASWKGRYDPHQHIDALAEALSEKNPVQFDEFHTYQTEGD